MAVKYVPQVHDGEHTMEQQMFLLASAAARVWKLWAHKDGKPSALQGISSDFDTAVGCLYREVYQTDIFMGGVHHTAR